MLRFIKSPQLRKMKTAHRAAEVVQHYRVIVPHIFMLNWGWHAGRLKTTEIDTIGSRGSYFWSIRHTLTARKRMACKLITHGPFPPSEGFVLVPVGKARVVAIALTMALSIQMSGPLWENQTTKLKRLNGIQPSSIILSTPVLFPPRAVKKVDVVK